LVRSLSAPVSGTSFGKLLLEDRYISTGAHIKRKHEVPEKLSTNAKGQRKDSFNFREKVSNIKYSLSLRKRLLSRKFQSMDLSQSNEFDSAQYMMNGPTIITGFRDRIVSISFYLHFENLRHVFYLYSKTIDFFFPSFVF